jgi:hypothetical protein
MMADDNFDDRWEGAVRGEQVPPAGMFDDEVPVDAYEIPSQKRPKGPPVPPAPGVVIPIRAKQGEALSLNYLNIPAILEPMPPIQWVQSDLYLCRGRPALWQGFGYSGKTITLQSLAMSLAWGLPFWGHWEVKERKRVVHLDYEQGEYATRLRYQRLAFAMGASDVPDPPSDQLRLVCMPDVYLTSPGVEDFLCRELDGTDIAVWDSLRAIVPGIDENDSVIRKYMDIWTRVSLKTGCAVICIHHAGKGGHDKDGREQGRGSSAIFDASGTVFNLSGKEVGAPILVHNVKTAAEARGAALEDFYLTISDVPNEDASDMFAGLRVAYQCEEQVNDEGKSGEAPLARIKTAASKIEAFLRKPPFAASATFLRSANVCDKNLVSAALELLQTEGRAKSSQRPGRGGGAVWMLADGPTDGFGQDR